VKRFFAAGFLALSISGALAALAPPASADLPTIHGRQDIDPNGPPCIRVNVTIFGNRIGTGEEFRCL
jgi:hypothetical protein